MTGHTSDVTVSVHPVAYDYDEYLEHEQVCNTRNEYLKGQIYAMAGAWPEHNRLVAAITGFIVAQLAGGRCRAYSSDQRIRVLETGLATYPDVAVICGRIELDSDDRRRHTATNPTVLMEVLSPSTEEYDRGEKFEHYKQIPALRQYVLASQDECKLDVWTREGTSWSCKTFREGDVAELDAIGSTARREPAVRGLLGADRLSRRSSWGGVVYISPARVTRLTRVTEGKDDRRA